MNMVNGRGRQENLAPQDRTFEDLLNGYNTREDRQCANTSAGEDNRKQSHCQVQCCGKGGAKRTNEARGAILYSPKWSFRLRSQDCW